MVLQSAIRKLGISRYEAAELQGYIERLLDEESTTSSNEPPLEYILIRRCQRNWKYLRIWKEESVATVENTFRECVKAVREGLSLVSFATTSGATTTGYELRRSGNRDSEIGSNNSNRILNRIPNERPEGRFASKSSEPIAPIQSQARNIARPGIRTDLSPWAPRFNQIPTHEGPQDEVSSHYSAPSRPRDQRYPPSVDHKYFSLPARVSNSRSQSSLNSAYHESSNGSSPIISPGFLLQPPQELPRAAAMDSELPPYPNYSTHVHLHRERSRRSRREARTWFPKVQPVSGLHNPIIISQHGNNHIAMTAVFDSTDVSTYLSYPDGPWEPQCGSAVPAPLKTSGITRRNAVRSRSRSISDAATSNPAADHLRGRRSSTIYTSGGPSRPPPSCSANTGLNRFHHTTTLTVSDLGSSSANNSDDPPTLPSANPLTLLEETLLQFLHVDEDEHNRMQDRPQMFNDNIAGGSNSNSRMPRRKPLPPGTRIPPPPFPSSFLDSASSSGSGSGSDPSFNAHPILYGPSYTFHPPQQNFETPREPFTRRANCTKRPTNSRTFDPAPTPLQRSQSARVHRQPSQRRNSDAIEEVDRTRRSQSSPCSRRGSITHHQAGPERDREVVRDHPRINSEDRIRTATASAYRDLERRHSGRQRKRSRSRSRSGVTANLKKIFCCNSS
ncbi:hypothetical protein QBC35DRAFT_453998 [Podospora australis]|uniref:Uncharacterized protein n=1 Tax=Podospora australis TaxID=1536484 RepID=A0AAN7AH99_9PEZI|nr:hypothetical protein QBC35DRAFT_453998 [Podospora australis]